MLRPIRLVIVLVVLFMLVRSALGAWRNRRVAVAVWRRIRLRHILGSLGLIAAVVAVAVTLTTLVPATQFGLGTLVGISGNAVFAPVQDVLLDDAPAGPGAPAERRAGWLGAALVTGFCGLLLALFPWLAYVEERIFREGLEYAGLRRQAAAALRFGLAHLAMLIPVAAALAIGVAGFVYGLIYRAAYRRAASGTVRAPGWARAEAVLASTVWHTTFNSLLVVLLLVGLATTLG